MAESSYMRYDVQGLRALAVILVMLYHFQLITSGGFVGVDVFFVISGYVIVSMLLREGLRNAGRIDLQRFYVRRGLRLLPALAALTTATVLVSIVAYSPITTFHATIFQVAQGASIWLANVYLPYYTGNYFDESAARIPLTHTWSLAVEEQFYFVIPAVLVFFWWVMLRRLRKAQMAGIGGSAGNASGDASLSTALPAASAITHRTIHRTAIAVIAAIGLISFIWLMAYSFIIPTGTNTKLAYYMSYTRAWEFCVGALVALIPQRRMSSRAAASAFQGLGVAIIVASAFVIDAGTLFPGYAALFPVAGAALAIRYGSINHSLRLLNNRIAVHIGDISYSLYLWHWPLWVFFTLAWGRDLPVKIACMAASYAFGLASYHVIEQRYRHLGATFNKKTSPRLAAAIAIPLVLSTALSFAAHNNWFSPTLARQNREANAKWTCAGGIKKPIDDISACVYGEGDPGKPIYLLGDSDAEMYAKAIRDRAKKLDRPFTAVTQTACLPAYVKRRMPDGRAKNPSCDKNLKTNVAWLAKQKPGTVIIASTYYPPNGPKDRIARPDQHTAAKLTLAQSQDIYTRGFVDVIRQLEAGGHTVRMVEVIPAIPGGDEARDCPWTKVGPNLDKCDIKATLKQSQKATRYWAEIQRRATEKTGSVLVPVADLVCPDGMCHTIRNGHYQFRDHRHLTFHYVDSIPQLARRLIGQ